MSNTRLHFAVFIRSKTPHSQLRPFTQPRSTSTTRRLHKASRRSIGPRVFKNGTNEQSSTARIILPRSMFSCRRGEKSLGASVLRSFSRFYRTKISREFAKRSHRSAIRSCYPKSAATARRRRKNLRKFSLPSLHHSPTPSLHRLPKHLSWRAQNQIPFC